MLSRRHFCCAAALIGTTVTPRKAFATDQCAALTRERQAAVTPEDALNELKAGNERFLSQNMRNCDLLSQVRATAGGQFPSAVVVGCIDFPRAPPELVFDQRIGDIFSARIAGNIVDDDIIGSAEFATKLSGAKLIVVLGHSECGAVKGAIDGAQLALLTQLLQRIKPAIDANKERPRRAHLKEQGIRSASRNYKCKAIGGKLPAEAEVLRDLVARSKLKIVSAMHDVASGRITFIE